MEPTVDGVGHFAGVVGVVKLAGDSFTEFIVLYLARRCMFVSNDLEGARRSLGGQRRKPREKPALLTAADRAPAGT